MKVTVRTPYGAITILNNNNHNNNDRFERVKDITSYENNDKNKIISDWYLEKLLGNGAFGKVVFRN